MELGRQASLPPRDPRIGQVLSDRYSLVRKIGEGGMGDVYEARHRLLDKRVAVKLLHSSFASRTEVLERFHREALAASRIAHANIVEVSDFGRAADGCPYMVLEFLEGHDLARELDRPEPIQLGRIVRIARQICAALAAAHASGIVHRDLKPENDFLCRDRVAPDFVKLLDFGISKFQGEIAGPYPMTVTGTALGTPYFMAPEQVEGRRDVDGRVDIWALGVILYLALTKVFPFDADSYPLLFVRICTADPVPIDSFRPDLPPEFSAIVGRILEKNPARRFRTCSELHAALAPFVDHDYEPRLRTEADLGIRRSLQPGALAIARAGTVLEANRKDKNSRVSSQPPAPPSPETQRMVTAKLDIPSIAPAPIAITEAVPFSDDSGARPMPRLPQGTYAPAGSWIAGTTDSIPPTQVELAKVPRPHPTPRRSPRVEVDEPLALPSVALRAIGVLALLVGVGASIRGLESERSILYGDATASGIVRDGFAIFAILVGMIGFTSPAGTTAAHFGRRCLLALASAVVLAIGIDFASGLLVR